ncbi:hypothetical protein [Secundilactobacillus collinoides]|uniref:Uncharacterized protein n=1 Tax=Secundilactobacillus collinoides TaxID=33960 RepID=A0A166FYB6_SECCO|nr:hypothetical protein [Secundilactobacillus collinoides]KZL35949.1 hypothetical protein TY91_14700 [Secundilactobacillus collinoides]
MELKSKSAEQNGLGAERKVKWSKSPELGLFDRFALRSSPQFCGARFSNTAKKKPPTTLIYQSSKQPVIQKLNKHDTKNISPHNSIIIPNYTRIKALKIAQYHLFLRQKSTILTLINF